MKTKNSRPKPDPLPAFSENGKGDKRRPSSISHEEFGRRMDEIFKKRVSPPRGA